MDIQQTKAFIQKAHEEGHITKEDLANAEELLVLYLYSKMEYMKFKRKLMKILGEILEKEGVELTSTNVLKAAGMYEQVMEELNK